MATTLSGGKEFFILFDRDFKEIKRFGNHPVRGMTTEANDFMQLQGEMVSYKNSFYFASRFFGYLCFDGFGFRIWHRHSLGRSRAVLLAGVDLSAGRLAGAIFDS